MTTPRRLSLLLVLLVSAAGFAASCAPSEPVNSDGVAFGYGGFAEHPEWQGVSNDDGSGGQAAAVELPCQPPKGKSLPARSAVTSATLAPKARAVFTADLFNAFRSHCGGCHVDTSLGGFDERVTFQNFSTLVTQDAIDEIKTDDAEKFMPPPVAGGMPWSERKAPDPILELVDLLEKWTAAGSPPDLFFLEPEEGASDGQQYLMTKDQGQNLTNIGSCLPDPAWFAKEEDESAELDEKFAAAMELPKRLDETDLTSWDHAELAYRGLVAFAPAYPLFSDDAGKVRHVRVPRGTSIAYDAETREFDIPENTRFYKTFLKQVVDTEGNPTFRKMETRLIVSRQDVCDAEGCEVRALYGTYAWNEAETEAVLVEDPLRNGEPFRDRVLTYFTDEQAAAAAGSDSEALAAVSRHYAIPGSVRCLQCHLGSPSKSFILGFSPIQIHRRPHVEEPDMFAPGQELLGHGVLEEDDPTEDELGQMQRMIDLGVVTGIEDPDSLTGLRDLGAEPPRNGYELEAQGYLLGNCSNCHNPRGFPSQKHPELRDLLNFYPSKDGGGIYQFPIDRTSPRVFRTRIGEPYADSLAAPGSLPPQVAVPYITPSLYDMPTTGGEGGHGKCVSAYYSETGLHCVEAPWRSLIYRNVDTPFTYAEDGAIFPHMPRHGSGFDCRAPRIVGNWMVSVPSIPSQLLEAFDDVLVTEVINGVTTQKTVKVPRYYSEDTIPSAQPRKEVTNPKLLQYATAMAEARARLESFQNGDRYGYCPEQSDIQDPEVLAGLTVVPRDNNPIIFPDVGFLGWKDGVPDRAHWVVLDTTEVPGIWAPRRGDWADILLGEDADNVEALDPDEKVVVETLASEDISMSAEFREYALTPLPFGWWKDPQKCAEALSEQPTLATLPASEVPTWGQGYVTGGSKDLPLYLMAPGAAVFQNICRNCHGPRGDGDSALAATIAEITGGTARVANLEHGLFGPAEDPGQGRHAVFGDAAEDHGIEPEDLALRYLLWMALGGTEVDIPPIALEVVQNTRILGQPRFRDTTEPSANMLNTGLTLCGVVLPRKLEQAKGYHLFDGRISNVGVDPLIEAIGDAEMWMTLCSKGAGPPVRVVSKPWTIPEQLDDLNFDITRINDGPTLLDPQGYGLNTVATSEGVVVGVPSDARDAWCVEKPTDPAALAIADDWLAKNPYAGEVVPYCPEGLPPMTPEEIDAWVRLGAINAGKAVFAYLDAVAKGEIKPQLGYDECYLLSQ